MVEREPVPEGRPQDDDERRILDEAPAKGVLDETDPDPPEPSEPG